MSSERGASIRARALRGALWVLMGNGATQGLRLVSNLILTRLLFPEAFGLMAIVNLVTNGMQMISNVGILPAIIRHADGGRRDFLDTAWTLQIARGAVLALFMLALARPIALFYDEPDLEALLAVSALVPLIDGFASTRLASLARQIDLRGTVNVAVLAKLGSIAAMVAYALWHRSVWALVIGSIIGSLGSVILSHALLPGQRDRPRLDRGHAREILTFGKWILVSTLFTFLSQRIDVVLLGRLVPMEVLGIYSIGLMLTAIPQRAFGQVSQRVLMPALAESHRADASQLGGSLLRAKHALLPVGAMGMLAGVSVAPAFFHFLYDARYADAGWIAQLAQLSLWSGLLHDANGRALLALGDSRSWAASHALRTAVSAAGCVVGFDTAGLPGLLVGLASGGFAGWALVVLALRRSGLRVAMADGAYTLLVVAAGILCGGLPYWIAGDVEAAGQAIAWLTLAVGALALGPPALWLAIRRRELFSGA